MKFFLRKNFHEVSSFNCQISKFYGYFFFPLTLSDDKRTDGKITASLRFVLYLIAGFFISIKSSEVNIGNSTTSIVIQMGLKIIIQLTFFMPTIFRVFNFVVRHRHEKIIANMQAVDDELTRLGIDINYRRHFLVATSLTTFYYTFLLLTFCVDDRLSSKYLDIKEMDVLGALLGCINVAAYLSYEICHMLIICAIYKRFQYLNQALSRKNFDFELVTRLRRIHGRLIDTLDLVNACFAMNLLNYFFQFLVFSIFFFFGLYHCLTAPDRPIQELIFNTITFFYFAFFFWFGAWIITISSWVESEGNRTKSLVHLRIARDSKTAKSRNNFCLQLDHNEPRITCGLFNVNWTIVFGFVSTLFSYLIILIQSESG